ncbi:helix-turn-helix domain-containing protein [Sedimentibacter hydroxybenzoicus DSM 7310]|uniref:Helix-turn-helix domain-containing protein n=1 Tax=Sedimentibacter hydroxybenzoicus DSM 7310 TaxID=1123245 RepID=A0A974BGT5_SEDHY|nr:helix-turn-helix domain-containing protein [Sedimentibacter hydroxybenzoicus]NYB72837.1 helix-turn-helix domain-containing protein [Sedimentibacter hydroxybenzoicus DSM 7310]
MSEKYYTVEQISKMLNIHPKTIQRYIREGKLRANKIGKSWRVTGHDLSIFAESTDNRNLDVITRPQDKAVVSSVIDIQIDDFDESTRIVSMLTAALNCKPQEYGKSTMHIQYLEHENKVRIALWGNIHFMKEMIEIISVVTEDLN